MGSAAEQLGGNITHSLGLTLPESVAEIKQRLQTATDLILPLDEVLDLLQQLTEFELGRFLLQNRGLNGKWIKHIVLSDENTSGLHPLEYWICNKCPGMVCGKQRYRYFQDITRENLRDGMALANIPAGEMDVLYSIDTHAYSDISITGLDIDPEAIAAARQNMKNYNINAVVDLQIGDAWNMQFSEEFDILLSNGLGFYVADDNNLKALYNKFYQAIKPGGLIVTSFVTPNPRLDPNSPWQGYEEHDIKKQISIFVDILQSTFLNYRTEQTMRKLLTHVGFKDINVLYDEFHIFPTITGVK